MHTLIGQVTEFRWGCSPSEDAAREIPETVRNRLAGSALAFYRRYSPCVCSDCLAKIWSVMFRVRDRLGHVMTVWIIGDGGRGVLCLDDDANLECRRCVIAQKVRMRLAPTAKPARRGQ